MVSVCNILLVFSQTTWSQDTNLIDMYQLIINHYDIVIFFQLLQVKMWSTSICLVVQMMDLKRKLNKYVQILILFFLYIV